jgi:hypothetical protein
VKAAVWTKRVVVQLPWLPERQFSYAVLLPGYPTVSLTGSARMHEAAFHAECAGATDRARPGQQTLTFVVTAFDRNPP